MKTSNVAALAAMNKKNGKKGYHEPDGTHGGGNAAKDALRERMERDVGWIKVTDDIPMNGSDVLAFQDNGEEARIVPVNYDKGVWYDCVFNLEADNITHWQPLPKPPNDEVDG